MEQKRSSALRIVSGQCVSSSITCLICLLVAITGQKCHQCWLQESWPTGDDFNHYIPYFLRQPPNSYCAKAGLGQFDDAVRFTINKTRNVHITSKAFVCFHLVQSSSLSPNFLVIFLASYLMAYRSTLKTSEDFYESLRSSREIADMLTEKLQNATGTEAEVRSYSFPDVFYEQYLTMWPDTIKSLGISIFAIFVVTFLFLGLDFYSAFIVAITILMIIVDLMAMMYWWDISLNAVSLVNLVVVSDFSTVDPL